MIYPIISTSLFFLIFLFFPASREDFAPDFVETWVWDKEGGYGTKPYQYSENPKDHLNGYKLGNSFFSFSANRFHTIPMDRLIDYPLTGEGFYEYKKLGDEIVYYNGQREMFWRKSYSSYPRPGYFSTVIPLVSGDGNTVFIADRNGNLAGAGNIDGRFAVDIAYSSESERTFVLFGGGEFFLFDPQGEILWQYSQIDVEHKDTYFAKSASLSPKGEYISFHYQSGDKDWIVVHNDQGKQQYLYELEGIYPHKLHFALSDNGAMLLVLPDKEIFINPKGKVLHENPSKDLQRYYNPILFKNGYFFSARNDRIMAHDAQGKLVYDRQVPSSIHPIRFIPGKKQGVVYVETKNDMRQITIF